MDLRTIKEKINSYANINDFLADVRLMFQNCSTFNRVGYFLNLLHFDYPFFFLFSLNRKSVNPVVY